MEAAIHQAIQDAQTADSQGGENTPFILNRLREITNGRTVLANRALVEANVARGTKVAVELAKLRQKTRKLKKPSHDR